MDYPSWLSRMMKKNHSEGYFFTNDHGGPYSGIRKNFMTGQTWNPHMMADPYMDKTWQDAVENPKLTEKQGHGGHEKTGGLYIRTGAVHYPSHPLSYTAWWPWVKNYYGEIRVGAHRAAPIMARIWIDQEMKKKMGY